MAHHFLHFRVSSVYTLARCANLFSRTFYQVLNALWFFSNFFQASMCWFCIFAEVWTINHVRCTRQNNTLDPVFKHCEMVNCYISNPRSHPPKNLVNIGVFHAAGGKSEFDCLKLHNEVLLWSNPRSKQQASTSEVRAQFCWSVCLGETRFPPRWRPHEWPWGCEV
jgi:hypothetical protein